MENKKIERINELSHKSKSIGLTSEEKAEQQSLRAEYIAQFRENLQSTLDNTYVIETDGTKRKLRKKDE